MAIELCWIPVVVQEDADWLVPPIIKLVKVPIDVILVCAAVDNIPPKVVAFIVPLTPKPPVIINVPVVVDDEDVLAPNI